MSDEDDNFVANMPTVIRRLSEEEFDMLFRQGFEVADYTLHAYYPDEFNHIGFSDTHWSHAV